MARKTPDVSEGKAEKINRGRRLALFAPAAVAVARVVPKDVASTVAAEGVAASSAAAADVTVPASALAAKRAMSQFMGAQKAVEHFHARADSPTTSKAPPALAKTAPAQYLRAELPVIYNKLVPLLQSEQDARETFLSETEGRRALVPIIHSIVAIQREYDNQRTDLPGITLHLKQAGDAYRAALESELTAYQKSLGFPTLKALFDYVRAYKDIYGHLDVGYAREVDSPSAKWAWHEDRRAYRGNAVKLAYAKIKVNLDDSILSAEAEMQLRDAIELAVTGSLQGRQNLFNRYEDALDAKGQPVQIPFFMREFDQGGILENRHLARTRTIPLWGLVHEGQWDECSTLKHGYDQEYLVSYRLLRECRIPIPARLDHIECQMYLLAAAEKAHIPIPHEYKAAVQSWIDHAGPTPESRDKVNAAVGDFFGGGLPSEGAEALARYLAGLLLRERNSSQTASRPAAVTPEQGIATTEPHAEPPAQAARAITQDQPVAPLEPRRPGDEILANGPRGTMDHAERGPTERSV